MKKTVSLLLVAMIIILHPLSIPVFAETLIATEKIQAAHDVRFSFSVFSKTLEITELGFKSTYTYVMGKLCQSCQYKELSRVNSNDCETAAIMLTDYTSVVLTVKNSEITSIVHVGSGDGTENSGLIINCSMIATIMAVDPSATASIALDILSELQESSGKYKTKYCSYQFVFDKDIGSVLTIEPA